jgi:hypothetical protein
VILTHYGTDKMHTPMLPIHLGCNITHADGRFEG